MKQVDRWLLPDGIEEMLPEEAMQVEGLRRSLVDLFRRWGYDYVIPPMLEFTDSLLTGSGEDISLLTFKMTDQSSGKMLGFRADITPQAARMDAHSLKREGVNRLCYAGHVAHTRAKGPLSSRTPIQAGVELFGDASIDADIEVLSLLLDTISQTGLAEYYLDLGHVGIFRGLSSAAQLSELQEHELFELLQAKAMTELQHWLEKEISEASVRAWFLALPRLTGSAEVLDKAQSVFAGAPNSVASAIASLQQVAAHLQRHYPGAQLNFDLSELRGYHYLTGMVFGVFTPGVGTAIANGGRYDHVGEAFGRARPATGFAVDLSSVRRLVRSQVGMPRAIFAPKSAQESHWQEVQKLRANGERVICGVAGQSQPYDYQCCDRILAETEQGFEIQQLERF